MLWWRPFWAATPRWHRTSSTLTCLTSWPPGRQAGHAWTNSSRYCMLPFSPPCFVNLYFVLSFDLSGIQPTLKFLSCSVPTECCKCNRLFLLGFSWSASTRRSTQTTALPWETAMLRGTEPELWCLVSRPGLLTALGPQTHREPPKVPCVSICLWQFIEL